YDVDAQSLHRRLRRLAGSLWNEGTPAERLRQGLITAESYDLPVGSFIGTKQIREAMLANGVKPTGNHIMDLVAYKIISESNAAGKPWSNALIATSLPQLLAPELVRGERMNVNRQWSNGRDDDGNNVVD